MRGGTGLPRSLCPLPSPYTQLRADRVFRDASMGTRRMGTILAPLPLSLYLPPPYPLYLTHFLIFLFLLSSVPFVPLPLSRSLSSLPFYIIFLFPLPLPLPLALSSLPSFPVAIYPSRSSLSVCLCSSFPTSYTSSFPSICYGPFSFWLRFHVSPLSSCSFPCFLAILLSTSFSS